jgi:two-component system catabolic regulation response regulator CreB
VHDFFGSLADSFGFIQRMNAALEEIMKIVLSNLEKRSPEGHLMKILVVEDEPAIADTVVYALETEGFIAEWVTTGNAALDIILNSELDLVVLDIGLPDISGFDVCRTVRQSSDIPIIFLTSRADEIDQVVGLELGADDYVIKPFSPRVLTARIRNRLRTQKKSENLSPAFVIDNDGLRILLDDVDLHLSRYEFRMLKVMMEHPGRVYSRAQLMDIAWEEPERSFDRTVDTHIKTIRQKIQQSSAASAPIRTHRGLGYSYQA